MSEVSEFSRLVEPVLLRHQRRPDRLLQILRDVQDVLDYLSDDTLVLLAEELKISYAQVRSTRDFYAFLYSENRGRYRILFSDNITDRMLGNQALFEQMLANFGLAAGQVSADGLVSVDLTSCTGMCDQGPAILVNELAITRMTPQRVDEICVLVRNEVPLADWPAEFFVVEDNIHRADMLLGTPHEPGHAIRAAITRGRDGMLAEMRAANLRGRGGAGFTTAIKWEACRQAPGEQRYIVCNADEGEPGTFKDRVLLQSYAGRVFEGMIIAGYTVGARLGLLYLRAELLQQCAQAGAVIVVFGTQPDGRKRLHSRYGLRLRRIHPLAIDIPVETTPNLTPDRPRLEHLAGQRGRTITRFLVELVVD